MSLALAPMQTLQLLEDPTTGSPASSGWPPRWRRAGASRLRSWRRCRHPTTRRRRCPTCARSTAGSTRAMPLEAAVGPGEIVIHRRRETVSPDGELNEEPNRVRIATFPADRLEEEAAAVGLKPLERRRIDARPISTSARRSSSSARRRSEDGAPGPRALSGADEHLRRPRQHHLPAAALRVARHRFLLCGIRAGRGVRPGGPRPALPRRRPGPRPARRRRGHGGEQARLARLRGRRRRRHARRLRRLPAARPQLPARRGAPARTRRSPTWRPCASPASG